MKYSMEASRLPSSKRLTAECRTNRLQRLSVPRSFFYKEREINIWLSMTGATKGNIPNALEPYSRKLKLSRDSWGWVFNDSERGGRRNPGCGLTTGLDRIDDQCTLKNKSRVPRYLAQSCLKNSCDLSDMVFQPQHFPLVRRATRSSTHWVNNFTSRNICPVQQLNNRFLASQ